MERGEGEEKLPPGFRFHPTDEELVAYYLSSKIADANFGARAIAEVDLNKCEPWDLPGKAKMGEKEWYFFSLRDRKYPTGVRTNRATDAGYWKTTGKDREIFSNADGDLVGMKKTLVFYRGRAPKGQKSNWIMHEYRLPPKYALKSDKDEWVVCRVFMKSSAGCSRKHGDDSYHLAFSPPVMPSLLDLDGFGVADSAELMELSKLAKGAHGWNQLLKQPQLSFPAGSFCFSNTPPLQPAAQPPCLPPSSLPTNCSITELENYWNWKRSF